MKPIKVNQIKYAYNYDRINEKYDFYEVKTSQNHFDSGSYLLDQAGIKVKSISFYRGNRFLVMMDKRTANDKTLIDILSSSKEAQYLSFEAKKAQQLENYKLAQLLLNALGSFNSESLSFNNLTGHLYCFHPAWFEKKTRNDETIVFKIPTLEISINSDDRMLLSVRTFSSELLRKSIDFKKKKFEEYPKYILSAHYTLRRKLATDNQTGYLMRQTRNEKKEVKFMDISSYDSFSKSKMGILNDVLNRFRKTYDGLAELTFVEIDKYSSHDIDNSVIKENKRVIKQELEDAQIKIVDYVKSDISSIFCQKLQSIIKEKYELSATIGKRSSEGCLNLCVIHNAEYYDGVDDPHQKPKNGVVQHVTIEDFMSHEEQAIQTVFHELLVKKDLKEGRIRLFDWGSLHLDKPLSFGVCLEEENKKRFFFMDVAPEGTFSIHEEEYNLFNDDEYSRLITIFEDSKQLGETVLGVLKYDDVYCKIIESNLFSVPGLSQISDELRATKKSLSRTEENRKALLSSVLDIKMFELNKERYYLVGSIGYGMDRSIAKAPSINKPITSEGQSLDFGKLLSLMSVTFVRNGQLTVLPFPFKYLREYLKQISASN